MIVLDDWLDDVAMMKYCSRTSPPPPKIIAQSIAVPEIFTDEWSPQQNISALHSFHPAVVSISIVYIYGTSDIDSGNIFFSSPPKDFLCMILYIDWRIILQDSVTDTTLCTLQILHHKNSSPHEIFTDCFKRLCLSKVGRIFTC